MEKILVTGANGFVGRQLCRTLSQKGFLVKAAIRQTAIAPAEAMHYVPVGDIGPDTDWTEALRGVELVVHLAGRAHIRRDSSSNSLAEYERTNTLGTIRLAQMAAAANVKRFLFLSSVKVNGEETHGQPFVETDRPAPMDFYAVSKWKAEEGLLHMHQQGKLSVVIIRPPLVYGPGVRANFLKLMETVRRGLPLPNGDNERRVRAGILEGLLQAGSQFEVHAVVENQVGDPGNRHTAGKQVHDVFNREFLLFRRGCGQHGRGNQIKEGKNCHIKGPMESLSLPKCSSSHVRLSLSVPAGEPAWTIVVGTKVDFDFERPYSTTLDESQPEQAAG